MVSAAPGGPVPAVAWLITDIDAFEPEAYAEEVECAPATVRRFGGRYLVRGGPLTPTTGDWRPE